ncbi:unnamed protein product [Closterium sp. NIES-54]
MYALSVSAEGDCYRCVPLDPGLEAAALGASGSALPGTAPAEAVHTFTLDSCATRCFFCDSTTLTPLSAPVPVRLVDPSGGPVLARSSTVLPCLAYRCPPGCDATTTTPGGLHVTICTFIRTGRHLATFTRRPRSSLYTLATEPPQVAVSAQVSLPPLPPSPAPPCLPCVEGRQRAAPHSSSFPSTTSPLQTLHMDVWGPDRVNGQDRERYLGQGPTPSGVSQVVPLPRTMRVKVVVDSGAARGTTSGGAEPASVEPGGAERAGAEPGGAEPEGAESGGAELGGAEPGGTEPEGAEPGGYCVY